MKSHMSDIREFSKYKWRRGVNSQRECDHQLDALRYLSLALSMPLCDGVEEAILLAREKKISDEMKQEREE